MVHFEEEYCECKTPKKTACEICDSIMPIKASKKFLNLLILGIMSGIFIGLAAEVSTLVTHDSAKYVGKGISKLLSGIVFSTGLIMVVLAGTELFTRNVMITISALQKKVSFKSLFRNWGIVYFANFIGSLLLVALIYLSGLYKQADFATGASALKIAIAKTDLTFTEAFVRGILCNCVVCLSVWLACTSRQVIGKISAIVFPITMFVASGYEHCIANMYYIPKALSLKAIPEVVEKSHISADRINNFTVNSFFMDNLVPVTLGNIVGGVMFISLLFWFVYIKNTKEQEINNTAK